MIPDRLAFIDVETSGPSPATDRIVEIGVVLVDQGAVTEWSTLLDSLARSAQRPWNRPKYLASPEMRPPRFQDVAVTLAGLLDGRLVVAHNARFDYNFLRAEFARVRMPFQPQVLCSLSLSRKLYPQSLRHDLDSIIERHGLSTGARHRALPDADVVRQFWQVAHNEHCAGTLAAAVQDLIAQPIYPPHLDVALIDRLPECAGIYVLYDEDGKVLDAGAAYNLKCHMQDYFRADCLSTRACMISHQVADIRCKITAGLLGARLELARRSEWAAIHRWHSADLHAWQFTPDTTPAIAVRPLDSALVATDQSYATFRSARRARNALHRLAGKHGLCLRLLGIAESEHDACGRCSGDIRPLCMSRTGRLRELVRTSTAISAHHNPAWPFAGPVGLRERGAIHVLHEWRHLGSAANDMELRVILNADPAATDFDLRMYKLIRRLLERHAQKLVPLDPSRQPPSHEWERGAS